MAMDAGVASRNLAGDAANRLLGRPATPDYTLPSAMFNQALDSVTQKPQGIGKAAEAVSSTLVGSGVPVPTMEVAPASFVPGVSDRPPPFPQPAAAPDGLTGAQQQALAAGRSLGMNARPGQAAGSKALQQLEEKLASHPSTSSPFNALDAQNQQVLNRATAHSIGETANTVDSSVLERANSRLGGVFQNVRNSERPVTVDQAASNEFLKNLDQENQGLLPNDMSIRDHSLVKQFTGILQRGNASAKQLGQLSSKLGKAAYKQMATPNGDRDFGQALYQVKDHVDDLVESALTPNEAQDYAAARTQYRNLMNLTSRVGIVNPTTGNVSGGALASRLQQADKAGFLYGKNTTPMYQAARFARAFQPVVGNSGTATRNMSLDPLALPFELGAHLGSRLYLSGAGRAVAPALVKGAPKALKGLMASPKWALTSGMPGLLSLEQQSVP
jgi:hypothetical protein